MFCVNLCFLNKHTGGRSSVGVPTGHGLLAVIIVCKGGAAGTLCSATACVFICFHLLYLSITIDITEKDLDDNSVVHPKSTVANQCSLKQLEATLFKLMPLKHLHRQVLHNKYPHPSKVKLLQRLPDYHNKSPPPFDSIPTRALPVYPSSILADTSAIRLVGIAVTELQGVCLDEYSSSGYRGDITSLQLQSQALGALRRTPTY